MKNRVRITEAKESATLSTELSMLRREVHRLAQLLERFVPELEQTETFRRKAEERQRLVAGAKRRRKGAAS